jgi:hypothetical protein
MSVITMSDFNKQERDQLLYPRSRYYGEFTPSNLLFNANLQEFTQRVSFICALETGGKLSPEQAYQEIRQLYKQLKKSRKQLMVSGDASSEP